MSELIVDGTETVRRNTIGSINGPWARLFKWMLAFNAILIPPVLGWCTWTTATLWEVRYDVHRVRVENFTTPMFVEVQEELEKKNPTIDWLTASEINEIRNHYIRDQ
jgi:hypothetical protein